MGIFPDEGGQIHPESCLVFCSYAPKGLMGPISNLGRRDRMRITCPNRQKCQRWPAAQRYHEACVSALDDRQILHKGETDFVLAHLESGMYIPPPLLLLQDLQGSVRASSHSPRPFTDLY